MRRARSIAAAALLALLCATAHADRPSARPDDDDPILPITPPERAFLLVGAPHRFVPCARAHVRVQLREGGEVRVALFRCATPSRCSARWGIGRAWRSRRRRWAPRRRPCSRAICRGARGSIRSGAPRHHAQGAPGATGRRRDRGLRLERGRGGRDCDVLGAHRRLVRARRLARALPAGLYLARVHAGPWAATAVLSVGDLVLLARRGDVHDVVRVSDADGEPVGGVTVTAKADDRVLGQRRTGPTAWSPSPPDAPQVRFVARRGDDVAWADVLHARLDPRDSASVPGHRAAQLYRQGEQMYPRGHVRGCDAQGRFVPLAHETVVLEPSGQHVSVVTDADGNFVARLDVVASVTARVRGQDSRARSALTSGSSRGARSPCTSTVPTPSRATCCA